MYKLSCHVKPADRTASQQTIYHRSRDHLKANIQRSQNETDYIKSSHFS